MIISKRRLWIMSLSILVVLFVIINVVILIEAFRYQSDTRNDYFHNPHLLVLAYFGRLFPGEGVPKSAILLNAVKYRPRLSLKEDLYYLSDAHGDRSIREHYFACLWKCGCDTKERLFWIVLPTDVDIEDNDSFNMLIYEYKTGRLVGCQEYEDRADDNIFEAFGKFNEAIQQGSHKNAYIAAGHIAKAFEMKHAETSYRRWKEIEGEEAKLAAESSK
jgi:hypothetical protein